MSEMDYSIYNIRGQRVMLDEDLASIYGVETKVMNQAIRRNIERFPKDFMFQITMQEYENLKSQIVTSSWGGRRKKPFVFTEHGVVMLATILRSKRAIEMSLEIVRAFVRLRHILSSQKETEKQLAEIRSYLLKRSNKTDREFKKVWDAIKDLSAKEPGDDSRQIGFKLQD